jgi:hypothetical protein
MLGQEEQLPGSLISFGACSSAFACGINAAEGSSLLHHFPAHPASLIFNPEARLGYYATCFLQENSPPFLHPDYLSLLCLHASAVAALSKTPSSSWTVKSDVLAQSLVVARAGSFDASEDISSIREICTAIMSDHLAHRGLDDAVGFDLEALHTAKLEAAVDALAAKAAAAIQPSDVRAFFEQLDVGGQNSSETADWPDASLKSTPW